MDFEKIKMVKNDYCLMEILGPEIQGVFIA
jgi:hypothetical protein